MTDAEQGASSPGPDHAETSGVDDMVEEGAPLEPQDVEAVEEVSTGSTNGGDSPGADGVSGSTDGGDSDPVVEAEQALAERTADLQRLQAEYANYRRRVERDREQVRENATYAALTPIVEVLDTIDRAREHGELDGGFKAVADQLERIVADRGLERFGAVGEEFDPTVHEALSHIGTDPEVRVTTCKVVAKTGYKIGDRVVRAAQVLVVDPEEPGSPQPVEEPAGEGSEEPPREAPEETAEEPAEEVVENE